MNIIKGKGQRLIPEELLKYLEAFKENHPDPTEGGGATLDDIVDSQGNKRFIEGDGTPGEISGITTTYCKWSLSGTHLMCVWAGNVPSSANIYANTVMVEFNLPEYIGSKIFPVFGTNNIESRELNFIRSGGSVIPIKAYIKYENNKLWIQHTTVQEDITYPCSFRFQVDLLIDTDYE